MGLPPDLLWPLNAVNSSELRDGKRSFHGVGWELEPPFRQRRGFALCSSGIPRLSSAFSLFQQPGGSQVRAIVASGTPAAHPGRVMGAA
jgi:hypothetical protein